LAAELLAEFDRKPAIEQSVRLLSGALADVHRLE